MKPKFCQKCYAEYQEEDEFCGKCGNALTKGSPNEQVPKKTSNKIRYYLKRIYELISFGFGQNILVKLYTLAACLWTSLWVLPLFAYFIGIFLGTISIGQFISLLFFMLLFFYPLLVLPPLLFLYFLEKRSKKEPIIDTNVKTIKHKIMKSKWDFKSIIYIYITLLAASFLKFIVFSGIFKNVSSVTITGTGGVLFLDFLVLTPYFLIALGVYFIAKIFVKKDIVQVILIKVLVVFGIVLFFGLTMGSFFEYRSSDLETKKIYKPAEDKAFEIISRIDEYKQETGSYPKDIYEFSKGGGPVGVTYNYKLCGSSYYFYFDIRGWWDFFVYDHNAKKFIAYDDHSDVANRC